MLLRHLSNLRISAKIYGVVGLLCALSISIAVLGLSALQDYNLRVGDMQNASNRAFIGEQINSLVYAVVMDSRGVYMARDRGEAEEFGRPLLKNLKEIESLIKAWRELLPADRPQETAAAFENIKKLIEFRTETVRRGIENGGPAAREFGDNDENRANRQSLNKEIDSLAKSTNSEIVT